MKNDVTDFVEVWTETDLNPLRVSRLGYRAPSDIILDFIRAGQEIIDYRNGYTDDNPDDNSDNFGSGNYFEDVSTSVDNLQRVQTEVEQKMKQSADFSTDSPQSAEVEVTEKPQNEAEIVSESVSKVKED